MDRFLESEGYRFSIFLNGSSGDISTKSTGKESSYEEVNRTGRIIGQKILDNFDAAVETDIEEFFGRKFSFPIRIKTPEEFFEGTRASFYDGENPFLVDHFNLVITVFKIDDHFFVIFPGELFSELAMKIADEKVHFINYANGYIGYIANQNTYDKNGYEALTSPFARGEGERLMEKMEDILKNWRKA